MSLFDQATKEAMAQDFQKAQGSEPGAALVAAPVTPEVAAGAASVAAGSAPAEPVSDPWQAALNPPNQPGSAPNEEIVSPAEQDLQHKSGYQKLKHQNQELQRHIQQQSMQANQWNQALAELREQNQYLHQQLQNMAQPKVDPNDPFQKLTAELKPEFQRELNPVIQRLEAAERQNQQLHEQIQNRARAEERARMRNQYTEQTNQALTNVLFKGAPVDDPEATQLFSKAITLLALAEKTSPENVAERLRRANLLWGQKFHSNSLAAAKMAASSKVPQPAPEGTTRAEGSAKVPTFQELATMQSSDGRTFSNQLAWRMAGSPQLFPRR